MIQLLLTTYAGFTHAFETDHLLAVGNIVSQRTSIRKSMKDGLCWGLGHTTTILFVGILMLSLRLNISEKAFHYLEAAVGLLLLLLGIYRLTALSKNGQMTQPHGHAHEGKSIAITVSPDGIKNLHLLSFGVGLVHGLAGSGELVIMVMLRMKTASAGILYLLIFGMGCLLGMLLAASAFSVPFYKKILRARKLQVILIIVSSLLCIGFGLNILYKNLATA